MSSIINYLHYKPNIAPSAFIADGARIIGNVEIGADSNIWFNCVIRGDVEPVKIGNSTNIQDGTVIHVTRGGYPTNIGDYVTIGHMAMLHACTIESYSFIGMGAILLDKVVVESGGMIAAGALISPGKAVRKGELWAGVPAKFIRNLSKEEERYILTSAENYVQLSKEYSIDSRSS